MPSEHSNIEIYKEPATYEMGSKKILLLPWIHPHTKQLAVIKEYTGKVDYLFCHSDLRGAKTGIKNVLKTGPTVADFIGYPKVYAGHIHLYQTIKTPIFPQSSNLILSSPLEPAEVQGNTASTSRKSSFNARI